MQHATTGKVSFKQPRGLATLFFTEMWERFSYYGMRAFLLYYMTATIASGGLGFSDADGASIYGTYTGSAWAASILGGIVADRWLGQYRTVLVGGIIIALGHFTLAVQSMTFFYAGLAFIAIGTGLLKPNVSTLVGSLYEPGDPRREAGFSFFYMGINLGAFFGPIIAGYVAQRIDWHLGFAVAGFGMLLGLVQYVLGRKHLQAAIDRLAAQPQVEATAATGTPASSTSFTATEWKRIAAIVALFVFASLFWGAYEQAGSTLALFADRYTRLDMFGFSFPSSWFQSVQPVMVWFLAPPFALLWTWLGPRQPSSPAKFAWALLFVSLAFVLLVPAASMAQSGDGVRVSPMWLFWAFFLTELGEMCLSPVGLSVVTKLSPVRIVGVMMGVWFLSNAAGNKIAGYAAGFFSTMPLPTLFGTVAAVTLVSAAILAVLVPTIKKMMSGVQ